MICMCTRIIFLSFSFGVLAFFVCALFWRAYTVGHTVGFRRTHTQYIYRLLIVLHMSKMIFVCRARFFFDRVLPPTEPVVGRLVLR